MSAQRRAWSLAILAACSLCAFINRSLLSYILREGGAFGFESLPLILAHSVYPAVLVLAAIGLSLGIGARLLEASSLSLEALEEAVLAFGLGAGVLAYGLFFLGIFGLLRPVWAALFVIAPAACFLPALARLLARRRPVRLEDGAWVFVGVILYVFWQAVAAALAPPTDSDVMAYHLALPKLYVLAGRIAEIPWLLNSHWPHLMDALYPLFLMLGSDLAPALWHVAGACALAALVFMLGRRCVGGVWAWAAAAVVSVQPVLAGFAGTARVDNWFGLYVLSAHHCAWRWSRERRRGWLVLAGLMAGFAAATKLLGLIPLLTLALWIAAQAEKSRAPAARREALLFLGCGLLSAAPWYVKTWLGTGNPVWPFLPSLLGGRWGPGYFLSARMQASRVFSDWSFRSLLRYDPQYLLGPLACAALWLRLRRAAAPVPPFLKSLLLLAVPYYLLLAWEWEFWRYLIPYIPALALLFIFYARGMWAEGGLSACLAAALLAAALTPVFALQRGNELFAVLELRSALFPGSPAREVYLKRAFEPHDFLLATNRLVQPERAKVLLFAMTEGYYLDVDYQWGTSWYQGVIPYPVLHDPEELASRLREFRVTHVLVDRLRVREESPAAVGLMKGLLAARGTKILEDGRFTLYRLAL